MGLFSSSKKTYVSSVVYNLAGPIEDRPDYLKSVILGSLLTEKKFKPAKIIQGAYTGGMGLRLRGYHRWSRDNYKQIGIPTDRFYGKRNLSAEVIAAILLSDYEIKAVIDWIDTGGPEIEMWGRQWMRENMPLKEQTDVWTVDFVEATREAMISFSDGTAAVVFKPPGYRDSGDWLYVSYSRPLTTNRWTTPQLFIYQRGTGSAALDAQFNIAGSTGEYLPFIPFRHETRFISSTYKPQLYDEVQSAYKKATGQKFDDLVDKIKENPDLGDIDFAYVFFGVSYNTKDMASRRYLYRYFDHLRQSQLIGSSAYNSWSGSQASTTAAVSSWLTWQNTQLANPAGSPLVGNEPSRPAVLGPPSNSVIIEDKGPAKSNLKMEIKWNTIQLGGGVGLGRPNAKKGDVWFTFTGGQQIVASAYTNDEVENLQIDTIEAYHQVSVNSWQKLIIRGMVHVNHIYDGKTSEITAAQALLDNDESGFLIPIHYDIFRQMSLVDSTQIGTQCVNIVFNCYQVVKKKWYQTTWFKILLVIIVIVITVVTGGTAGPAGAGLLGTSAGVGAALGFSGLAAIIAGTVANMIAGMIVTKLITYASVELLGEKIGYIVAAIASIVALQIGTGLQAGQSLAQSLANFATPMNLVNFTSSIGNGYAGLVQAGTMDVLKKSQEALDDFRKQSLKLQENYAEQFGYGSAVFNPMSLTEIGQGFFAEPSETFLSRTLLTGSDMAQMSNDMINNFVGLTLRNEFSDED